LDTTVLPVSTHRGQGWLLLTPQAVAPLLPRVNGSWAESSPRDGAYSLYLALAAALAVALAVARAAGIAVAEWCVCSFVSFFFLPPLLSSLSVSTGPLGVHQILPSVPELSPVPVVSYPAPSWIPLPLPLLAPELLRPCLSQHHPVTALHLPLPLPLLCPCPYPCPLPYSRLVPSHRAHATYGKQYLDAASLSLPYPTKAACLHWPGHTAPKLEVLCCLVPLTRPCRTEV